MFISIDYNVIFELRGLIEGVMTASMIINKLVLSLYKTIISLFISQQATYFKDVSISFTRVYHIFPKLYNRIPIR